MKYIILNLPSEVREHQYLEFELGMNQDIADIFDSASFVTHPPYGGGSGIDGNDRFIPLSGDDGDSATVSPADSIAGTAILRAEGELLSRSVYYADGTRAVVYSEADSSRVRYIGSMVYVSTPDGEETLSGIVTANGYIDWRGNATDSQMQYFLRDHLGSVRVVAADRNTVISRRDYLPSGVQMTGNGLTTDYSQGSSWYGFSGKESERWNGPDNTSSTSIAARNWSEDSRYIYFGARIYDPVSCIFLQTDPLAEKYYEITSYSYCVGNPINNIDPDGNTIIADKQARINIKHTLTKNESRYVKFNSKGVLNNKLLVKSESKSNNLSALKTLSNSTTVYNVSVGGDAFGDTFFEKGQDARNPENYGSSAI